MGRRTQLTRDQTTIVVGTLAADASKQTNTKIDGARQQGIKVKRVKAGMTFNAKTTAEGPIEVGLTTGLSAAESQRR